jgi:hypothetical protein
MASLRRLYRRTISSRHISLLLLLIAPLLSGGCRKSPSVDDPQLARIQEILKTELPPGTTADNVSKFLAQRGYATAPEHQTGTLVAVIPESASDKSQSGTALATFYFDANGKLNTIELTRTADPPTPH